ncbi:MAG: hypothetical protein ABSC37_05765 [Xanthobacteraceae bacterium]
MTPAEFVNEIVQPTIQEFRDERRSRRRAYLACIVVYHIKDYLEKAGEKDVFQKMKGACPSTFELVRSICNGSKHVHTNLHHEIPFHAGDDWDRPPARAGVMRAGISRAGDATGGREAKVTESSLDLYGCVKTLVLTFQQKFPVHLSSCDLHNC